MQTIHKKGISKVYTTQQYMDALRAAGLTIIAIGATALHGVQVVEAAANTPRGELSILCGANGAARIDKPNGTHKWMYDKSPAQVAAAVKQTLEFYNA